MKKLIFVLGCFLLIAVTGCAPAIMAGGATGAYKVATDERTAGRFLDDKTITGKVKAKLIDDPVVKARKIDVDTIDSTVILTGVVETGAEAGRAADIARKVPGVKRVKNDLQIGSKTFGQGIDDKWIGSKIKGKLIKEPGIHSLNIDVDVNRGIVTLSGIVHSEKQKSLIIAIARNTSGVVNVIDNIVIK
ncbi:MAG: BON domain-containing protein [Desulfobacterales bacterium]|nr:BON domain-containing protein [Desulfobacterales bacterium]MDD4071572.1 BON domain-containing protein [Desulfobacterales bacterium]MDD4391562.1 BON domain-containing protein [Desulfobacterales bacterium]